MWLKEKFGYQAVEPHYNKIKPRIICERYIETQDGKFPNDYKFYCFNGKVELVLVCSERDKETKKDFLDLDWNLLNLREDTVNAKELPIRPKCFEDMIKYAEILSKPFKFVRVDLYDYNR